MNKTNISTKRATVNQLVVIIGSGEQTDAYAKCALAQSYGMTEAEADALIDEAIDAGRVVPTIIDGRARCAYDRDFGFIPALRRA